ncbi:MAG: hypothetical protein M3P08_10855, partial [Thermoproteota archaeon]|nr:hypothetical protein [Thermoproteota archaeon]
KIHQSKHVPVQLVIRYSHAMTCLMAYHNKKRTESISIVLQATHHIISLTDEGKHALHFLSAGIEDT